MHDFYITQDIRANRIFIAPTNVNKERPWLIEFESLWEADQCLKKLLAKMLKCPLESNDQYLFHETILEQGEKIDIYHWKK